MCFDVLYNFCPKYFSLYEEMREILSEMYIGLHVNTIILVRFELNFNRLDRVFKNTQISNFMKILPIGAQLLHADRRTDMTKLIVAFCSFVNIHNKPLFVEDTPSCPYSISYIQGIHKRMVRFQKLKRYLFLVLHGHNVHRQQRQLSKFLTR